MHLFKPVFYKVFLATTLIIILNDAAISQITYELPVVKLFDKNKAPVLISNISEYGKPMLLLTYSQKYHSSTIKLIDSIDAHYRLKTKDSPQIIAVNQDSQLSENDVFS